MTARQVMALAALGCVAGCIDFEGAAENYCAKHPGSCVTASVDSGEERDGDAGEDGGPVDAATQDAGSDAGIEDAGSFDGSYDWSGQLALDGGMTVVRVKGKQQIVGLSIVPSVHSALAARYDVESPEAIPLPVESAPDDGFLLTSKYTGRIVATDGGETLNAVLVAPNGITYAVGGFNGTLTFDPTTTLAKVSTAHHANPSSYIARLKHTVTKTQQLQVGAATGGTDEYVDVAWRPDAGGGARVVVLGRYTGTAGSNTSDGGAAYVRLLDPDTLAPQAGAPIIETWCSASGEVIPYELAVGPSGTVAMAASVVGECTLAGSVSQHPSAAAVVAWKGGPPFFEALGTVEPPRIAGAVIDSTERMLVLFEHGDAVELGSFPLNQSGNDRKTIADAGVVHVLALDIDPQGGVWIAGRYGPSATPVPVCGKDLPAPDEEDGFVLHCGTFESLAGTWFALFRGPGRQTVRAIARRAGAIAVAGETSGTLYWNGGSADAGDDIFTTELQAP